MANGSFLAQRAADRIRLILQNRNDDEPETYLRQAFAQVDRSRDGFVDMAEFEQGIQSFGITMTHPEVRSLFMQFDKDGDNQLSVDEFVSFVLGGKRGKKPAARQASPHAPAREKKSSKEPRVPSEAILTLQQMSPAEKRQALKQVRHVEIEDAPSAAEWSNPHFTSRVTKRLESSIVSDKPLHRAAPSARPASPQLSKTRKS